LHFFGGVFLCSFLSLHMRFWITRTFCCE
jgi:hypothetical protein